MDSKFHNFNIKNKNNFSFTKYIKNDSELKILKYEEKDNQILLHQYDDVTKELKVYLEKDGEVEFNKYNLNKESNFIKYQKSNNIEKLIKFNELG